MEIATYEHERIFTAARELVCMEMGLGSSLDSAVQSAIGIYGLSAEETYELWVDVLLPIASAVAPRLNWRINTLFGTRQSTTPTEDQLRRFAELFVTNSRLRGLPINIDSIADALCDWSNGSLRLPS